VLQERGDFAAQSFILAGFGKEGRAPIWLALQSGAKELLDLPVAFGVHDLGFRIIAGP
jgi:hypothetical protein